jgi:dienelactone hydrolase
MTQKHSLACLLLLCGIAPGCGEAPDVPIVATAFERGPYAVGSTNMQVAAAYQGIGDELMHAYLLGQPDESGQARFITDILEHPEAAFITDVPVPEIPEVYGPASGLTLPVVTFVAFPSRATQRQNRYAFPYHDAMYGAFEDMLSPGEPASFADAEQRYPLIILAHGAAAHGIYDVGHAHSLASHGYIVAVVNYGDNRTADMDKVAHHASFLRPLLTKAVLDALLADATFGPRIDTDNIGITGHSFGGFTALALAGGRYRENAATVNDERITAAVIAAPWVGGNYESNEFFAFGPDNADLARVSIPVISFFGTKDEDTLASFILPAMKKLSGPTYVIELVDQPHIFAQGSWEDRDNWELLFFSAYLQHDTAALELLRTATSMAGGNTDVQLFDYQKLPGND